MYFCNECHTYDNSVLIDCSECDLCFCFSCYFYHNCKEIDNYKRFKQNKKEIVKEIILHLNYIIDTDYNEKVLSRKKRINKYTSQPIIE